MKRRFAAILGILLLLTGCSPQPGQETAPTYHQISMEEAVEMMDSETDCIILDVRRDDEFAEGHIPNAVNYPLEDIGSGEIGILPDKAQRIFIYCRSGRRSKLAAQQLAEMGYTDLWEFGGILDWTGDIVQ